MVEAIVAPILVAVFVGFNHRESVHGASVPTAFVALDNELVVYGLGINLTLGLSPNRGHGK